MPSPVRCSYLFPLLHWASYQKPPHSAPHMCSGSREVIMPGEQIVLIPRCRAHETVICDDPPAADVLLLYQPYRQGQGRMSDATQTTTRTIEDANFRIVPMVIGLICAQNRCRSRSISSRYAMTVQRRSTTPIAPTVSCPCFAGEIRV
jgi:hypothetical protein